MGSEQIALFEILHQALCIGNRKSQQPGKPRSGDGLMPLRGGNKANNVESVDSATQ